MELAQLRGMTRTAFGTIGFALDINADGGDRFMENFCAQLVVVCGSAGSVSQTEGQMIDRPVTERAKRIL